MNRHSPPTENSDKAPQAVLVVDDQRDFAAGLTRLILSQFPEVNCRFCHSAEEALQELDRSDFDVLITDLRMPKISGQDLLTAALSIQPSLTVIMLTAYGTVETAVAALKEGAYDFLTKPIDQDHLFRIVSKALERSRLLQENARLREKTAECACSDMLVGESPAMRRLHKTIAAVAASDYTVLIRGESGTGKELVARSIQALSRRANAPFVIVNCPSIPDTLLESELFGHIKGAFTGADRTRKGLFVAADRGTILLDEIGDIPAGVQAKLLRVLQDGEVRPVGANIAVRVNLRILASTNRNLEAKITDQGFREDLYFRLNVLTIHVPPLRERAEDIPLIANHFLVNICGELASTQKEFSPEVLSYLTCRQWPGNVRELLNFVRRLAVFCPDDRIGMAYVRLVESGISIERDGCNPFSPYKETKQAVLAEFTRNYVRRILEHTQGNISEAARIIGIERFTLQKIIKRLNIDTEIFRKG